MRRSPDLNGAIQMEIEVSDKKGPPGARDGHRRGGGMGTQERPALGSFRKVSKPLMEKKRRARINLSLEQLRGLLEKHYSHQIRKRKLEKADILELSVKYMRSLQLPAQGARPVLLRPPQDRDLASCALAHGRFSTTESGHGADQALPAPGRDPLASPKAAAAVAPSSPGRRRARPLKPLDGSPEGEDSTPAMRAGWSRAPRGQDRLPARSRPLWRPW